jgi:hypothetical protein
MHKFFGFFLPTVLKTNAAFSMCLSFRERYVPEMLECLVYSWRRTELKPKGDRDVPNVHQTIQINMKANTINLYYKRLNPQLRTCQRMFLIFQASCIHPFPPGMQTTPSTNRSWFKVLLLNRSLNAPNNRTIYNHSFVPVKTCQQVAINHDGSE